MKLVVIYLKDRCLYFKWVFGVVLIKLLMEQFDTHVVHKEVFARTALIEIVKVLVVFFVNSRALFLQLTQRVNLLFLFVLLFDGLKLF